MPNLSFICIPAASNIPMNGNDPQPYHTVFSHLNDSERVLYNNRYKLLFSIHLLYGNNIPTIFEIDQKRVREWYKFLGKYNFYPIYRVKVKKIAYCYGHVNSPHLLPLLLTSSLF